MWRIKTAIFIISLASIFLLSTGCQKPDPDLRWIEQNFCNRPSPLNPYLILGSPYSAWDSQQFSRYDWPSSPEATKYVTTTETTYYGNYTRDFQINTPSGRPSNYFRSESRGYQLHQYRR